jgi:hypothetical protein
MAQEAAEAEEEARRRAQEEEDRGWDNEMGLGGGWGISFGSFGISIHHRG